jgi:DNA-directed RNA polymerase specialized sigma24 family protein
MGARVLAKARQRVELRYFDALSEQDIADVLAISRRNVRREWQTARTRLYRRMTGGAPRKRS